VVSQGDRYERASYCVLAGESVARALSDPTCNSKAGAEDSQGSVHGYPEPDAGATAASTAGSTAGSTDPAPEPCPQPWCSFSLVRLQLTGLGSAASPEPMVTGAGVACTPDLRDLRNTTFRAMAAGLDVLCTRHVHSPSRLPDRARIVA